jgi:glyoxylase-like metal-dependent hydrolase (beta-lactamase superfamily II)
MGVSPEMANLPLARTIRLGDVRLHALEAGLQRLDGGAMFGVVPKPLWERRIPADNRNRIPLALRCLLIESGQALVLVDTGIGAKEDDRFREIYGVENNGSPTRLENAIRAAGFEPDDVDVVVNTHLHFDHAGGNTVRDPEAGVLPAFPRARHVVQRAEYDFARLPNERIRASYMPENYEPVAAAGLWEFVAGEAEVVPGVTVLPTPGHTPHHQSVLVRSGGQTACFLGDLVPTTAHLPLPWIMGYDLEPLITLETKRNVLARAREEEWLLVFEHDPVIPWGRLDPTADRPQLTPEPA